MSGLQCQNYSTRREDDSSDESEQGEMDEDEEEEIPLDMEVKTVDQHKQDVLLNYLKDVEAVSKKARQDDDLGTEHLQVKWGEGNSSTCWEKEH